VKRCGECGAENPDDAEKCEKCGEPFAKGRRVATPVVITRDFIAEQVWRAGAEEAAYAVRRFGSDKIETAAEIDMGDTVYAPLNNPTLKKGLVLLPERPEEATFEQVYREGCDLALTMYDCEPQRVDEVRFLVAVSQSSWFLDRFYAKTFVPGMGAFAPIIALRGPSGSGKDRLMNALRLNSYRPFYDVSTRRIPSLYRPLDQWRGTLCLSEMDFRSSDETSELVHYLNCRSYGVPISRQNPDNPRHNEVFYNFGLSLVTQRRVWDDNALEDRTLPFYCEKSQKPLPTAELDEWIERGISLMDKLLYLRLQFWDRVVINKAARIPGVRDHRLTAAVLPLIALSKFFPELMELIQAVLGGIERRRREVKAMSRDGLIVNLLYEYFQEGLIGEHNGAKYVAKETAEDKEKGTVYVPLQTSDIGERLGWKTRDVRNVINSLQLHPSLETLPKLVRVGKYVARPIWVDEGRLRSRFEEFVPDFVTDVTLVTLNACVGASGEAGAPAALVSGPTPTQGNSVTSVTSVTNKAPQGAGETPAQVPSLPDDEKRLVAFIRRERAASKDWAMEALRWPRERFEGALAAAVRDGLLWVDPGGIIRPT
jgi:hypothetical protein